MATPIAIQRISRSQVAHGEGTTVLHLALALGYAAAYVAAALALAVIAFERRELK